MASSTSYWVDSLEKTSEPLRNNRWLCNFNFNGFGSGFPDAGLLSLHVKNVDIPTIQLVTDSIHYQGIERKMVTSADNAGSISMSILEGEDLIGYSSIMRWNQLCANIGQYSVGIKTLENNTLNQTAYMNRPDYSSAVLVNTNAISIDCFSYCTGNNVLHVSFVNIKPIKIGSVKLAYDSNELYKYDVTFEYDDAIFANLNVPQIKPATKKAILS